MSDKLIETCPSCADRGERFIGIGGKNLCTCGKGRLGPGVVVADGVDEVALLTHLEEFGRETYSLAHVAREMLIEKLCRAVAEWLSDEADRVYKIEKFSDHSRSDVIELLSWRTAEDENLAVLLDHALGEVK